MRSPVIEPTSAGAPAMTVRRARFEDVAPMLRLIERAVEFGCRQHYGPEQRRAVFLSYAQHWFIEVLETFDTVVGQVDGRLIGVAQLDLADGRLRALFVDAAVQGQGRGAELLGWAERRLRAAGGHRLHGAMSLNAVPFYARAGFEPGPGNRWLSHSGVTVPVLPMQKLLITAF